MNAPPALQRVLTWLRADNRRTAAAGLATVVLGVALAGGIYAAASGGGDVKPAPTSTPGPTPAPGVCEQPTLIDALPTGGPDDWEGVQPAADPGCFSLTAADFDAGGVATGTSFVLNTSEEQDPAELTSRIRVDPAVEFTVAASDNQASRVAVDGYTYHITPSAPLGEGEVYRFTLLDAPDGQPIRNWAFQTQQPLRVVATLPADQSTAVPTNIGIELTFSLDGVAGAQERFEIVPPTEGRFEVHKRVLVFVPKSLQPATLYTVTLKAGAGVPGGATMDPDFRFQFETGNSERTGDYPGQPAIQFSRRTWESSTAEAPAVALFGQRTSELTTLPFTVYRFDDTDSFLAALDELTAVPAWASASRARISIDPSDLEEFTSFDGPVHTQGQYYYDSYVLFPEALPEGLYLVETQFEGAALQTLLQVTNVGVYVSLSRPQTLLWVNDLATKSPLNGASISSPDVALSAATDADGVAQFQTPGDLIKLRPSYYGYSTTDTVGNLIVTAADGRSAIVPLADIYTGYNFTGFREYTYRGDPGPYWRFVYTERHVYRLSDTLHFWGLARQRENAPAAEQVQVKLTGSAYNTFGSYEPTIVAQTTVTSDAIGAFIGELSFQGASPGYYELQASIGDQVLASTYVEVQDFVTPAYQIDVSPARRAILIGETIDIEVKASFYDGTPVPNLALNYRDYKGESTPITTNSAGATSVSYDGRNPPYGGEYYPWYDYLSVVPANPEEGEITGSTTVQVFGSDIVVDAQTEYEDGQGVITGTVYNLDLTRINGGAQQRYDDYRGTPVAGRQVNLQMTRESYNKIEIGEYYDFIQKIVHKQYRYEPVRTPAGSVTAVSDAQGNFRATFAAQAEESYSIALSAQDNGGRIFSRSLYLYSGFYKFNTYPQLSADSQGPFVVGDRVSVTMSAGDEPYPSGGDNRYLFYLAQNGIRSHEVRTGPEYDFTFAEEHIPNVSVVAVRFTGNTFVEVQGPLTIDYDQSERELTVAVQPQQEEYAPGDTAGLDVAVTDRDGNPVQAEVLLSAIDEAVYDAAESNFWGNISILDQLYTSVPSGILHTYTSHQYPVPQSGGERGGDGGGGARREFEDVALFQQVSTDAGGHASVTFDLPDNLTSWRVSALAVTSDLYAGTSVTLVPVTLPLFVDVTMNTSYLLTDRPDVTVRAFGDALEAGSDVAIEVTSPTLFDDTIEADGTAFEPASVALPELSEGRHEIHIKVSAAGLSDEIVRTIEVVPSRLLATESHYYEASPGNTPDLEGSGDRLTTVAITDHNRGRYYPVLSSLSWTWGDRLDQMLARNRAQDMLRQYFGEDPPFPAEFRGSAYQTTDGGVAIFPFADDDLELTARVAALAPDDFGRSELVRYLQGVYLDLEETRERALIALYGLATLGEPVLIDVQAAAALGDLTYREQLYVALSAAALGDEDTALSIYGDLLDEFGERRGASIRLNVGEDQDDILEATSLGADLAGRLGDDYAPLLFEYTTQNYTRETLIQLEQLTYLAAAMPRMSDAPVNVTYKVDGDSHEESLERGQSIILRLAPDQLDDLYLEVTQGTAGVTTSFLSPLDPGSVEQDPAAAITRRYEGESDGSVSLDSGQLVRITLDWNLTTDAVDGCYQVSDLLPSGLKPVTRIWERGIYEANVWYPYFVEGQRVSFCVSEGSLIRSIVYYARVVNGGTYTAEPAVIQSQQAQESIALTGSTQVEIP